MRLIYLLPKFSDISLILEPRFCNILLPSKKHRTMTGHPLAKASMHDLDSEDRLRVLGIIDRFRELGINEDISLPQLVVVGDQSSGKSSLLEGLTGLNFPIASELCTRFATQIVFRRSLEGEGTVRVSILPGPTANSDEEQKAHLKMFAKTIEGSELSSDVFGTILDEAAVHMGLPAASDQQEDLTKRFSDDVLRIELSGPEHHHLSVVDVPGLFHNPTKFQTREDLDIIRSLLQQYMSDTRTIILGRADVRKLRMHICLENEQFASTLAKTGHARAFRKVDDTTDEHFALDEEDQPIYDWIRQIYRESRGAELPGTVNPVILENVFRQQAKQWRVISESHLSAIDKIVSDFNQKTLETTFVEEDVRQRILVRNQGPSTLARENAKDQLQKLLTDEMCGILQTANHYFADNLTAARRDQVIHRLKKLGFTDDNHKTVNLSQLKTATHLSNEDQAVYDIHDILKAYYKVALKRFTDNVIFQVIERHYFGPTGPVAQITPEYIGELSDADLEDVARETYGTAKSRNDTSARLQRLEEALKIAEEEGLRGGR
ncbi:hypothetical protein Q7P37_000504 [Cladosporium fusiforme]